MWIADALTLSRVPIAILVALTYGDHRWTVALVGLAALTDALDGRVARYMRRRHGIPEDAPSRGDWLDPIADKLFVVIVLATVVAHQPHAWTLVGLVAAREIVLVPIAVFYFVRRHRPARTRLRASPIGKAATIVQFFAIAALIAWPATATWLAIAAAVTGVAAAAQYVAAS